MLRQWLAAALGLKGTEVGEQEKRRALAEVWAAAERARLQLQDEVRAAIRQALRDELARVDFAPHVRAAALAAIKERLPSMNFEGMSLDEYAASTIKAAVREGFRPNGNFLG